MTINLHAAKTNLSQLVEQALAGEDIVIAKANKPMVRLTPVEGPTSARTPGSMKGKIRMHDDFDAPLPADMAEAFGFPMAKAAAR